LKKQTVRANVIVAGGKRKAICFSSLSSIAA